MLELSNAKAPRKFEPAQSPVMAFEPTIPKRNELALVGATTNVAPWNVVW